MPARRWPVSFRFQRGEILYSWLARTAGVYGLSPDELLPENERVGVTARLVHEASPALLKSLAVSSGISVKALAKRTLVGASPVWPSSWWLAHFREETGPLAAYEPSLQVCPRCITDDVHSGDGVQFLRLRWQCSATTICQKHLVPLEQACVHCHSIRWPICESTAFHRYRFVCVKCGGLQEKDVGSFVDASEEALQLLARFENQLLRALANRAIEWYWIGHATAHEFLRLVEDLLWAITRPSYSSKPIYRLQTSSFPFCERSLSSPVTHQWRFASPKIRRCLLAAVLSIFANSKTASVLQSRSNSPLRWSELLVCLTAEYRSELERRSWLWPPAAHNALRRGGCSARDRRLFHSMGRPLSTDIRKTRRAVDAVY
jgi:hypothetical protein